MPPSSPRAFLGVHFTTCAVYGRLYKNSDGTAYEGRCPRCGFFYRVRIGPDGSRTRTCQASCPPSVFNRNLR